MRPTTVTWAPAQAREGDEHQADRPGADHRHRLPAADPALLHPPHDAREGLDHRRLAEPHALLERHEVVPHHPGGDAGELRVGPVPEEEVVAQARAVVPAVVALAAGGRVGHDHGRARLDALHPRPHLLDDPGHLVAEDRGRGDHPRVVAAPVDLEVGAAGERHLGAEEHVPGLQAGDVHLLDPHVLAAVEHGGLHPSGHRLSSPAPGHRTTLSVPGRGLLGEGERLHGLLHRQAVAHQLAHAHRAVEDEVGGQLLHLDRRAVGGEDVLLGGGQEAQVHLGRLPARRRGEREDTPSRPCGVERLAEGRPTRGRHEGAVGAAPLRHGAHLRRHLVRRVEGLAGPERQGERAPPGERIRDDHLPPAHRASCMSSRPIAPWPTTSTDSPFGDRGLAYGLQARVDGLDEGRLLRQDAVGNGDRALLDDPVERQHVLRVAAARGLEAGRRPVLLVEGALGVPLPRAVEAGPAGHVVVHDHALALAEALRARTERGDGARRSRGRRPGARAGGPSRSSSGRSGRCRRRPPARASGPPRARGTGTSSTAIWPLPR